MTPADQLVGGRFLLLLGAAGGACCPQISPEFPLIPPMNAAKAARCGWRQLRAAALLVMDFAPA